MKILMITYYIKEKKNKSRIKLLWGKVNCFSNPKYINGTSILLLQCNG